MKKIILLFIWGVTATMAFGQQEAIFSQFTGHKLFFNPGYAGSGGIPCLTLSHREQWVGLEGAPSTSAFAIHAPVFAKKVGLGLSVMNDNIGYQNILSVNTSYAYRILFKKSFLGLGLQASYRRYSGDVTQATIVQGGDEIAGTPIDPFQLFNVGVGAYYESEQFFIGASAPRLMKKSLNPETPGIIVNNDTGERPHYFLMSGLILPINKKLKFKPAFLAKYTKHAPLNFDLHASLGFMDNLWLGATYRWGTPPQSDRLNSSVSALVEYRFKGFKIGAAYDYSLGKIRNTNTGTFELMLGYCGGRGGDHKGVRNPRFF